MDADEVKRIRSFLKETGAQGIAVEGWDGAAKMSGKKPDETTLERLRSEKAAILALFAWLESGSRKRHGLVSMPDVEPWELRIDWAGGLPLWMGAWERKEGVSYARWENGYGFQPETPEQTDFRDGLRRWTDERAALLMGTLNVDAATALVMAAADLVAWQFGVDRAGAWERCRKLMELVQVQQEMRKRQDED